MDAASSRLKYWPSLKTNASYIGTYSSAKLLANDNHYWLMHCCDQCLSATYYEYKAKIVCLCVHNTRVCYLLRHPQTCCGCWGHWGSGYSRVDSTHLVIRKELSVHFRFYPHGRLPFSRYRSHRLPVFTRLDSLPSHGRI